MIERRWWRLAVLILIAVLAGLFAAFNSGERVALNLGFTMLYRSPLVPMIFLVFLAGMTTMLLVGLRHDARVRRALRDAGLGAPISAGSRRLDDTRPDREAPIAPFGADGRSGVEEGLSRDEEEDPAVVPPPARHDSGPDGMYASWVEASAVEAAPEPLPPDQEPRDPP